jgi:hypothetical protein
MLNPNNALSLADFIVYKGNNKITELRTILQRENLGIYFGMIFFSCLFFSVTFVILEIDSITKCMHY